VDDLFSSTTEPETFHEDEAVIPNCDECKIKEKHNSLEDFKDLKSIKPRTEL
jgi:hypothetical protein